jgi:hypothetical protein
MTMLSNIMLIVGLLKDLIKIGRSIYGVVRDSKNKKNIEKALNEKDRKKSAKSLNDIFRK